MASKEEKELWIEFAHSAMGAYSKPEDIDDEDVVDDMAEVASGFADAMLDALDERFGNEKRSTRRRKARKEEDE